jgi:hypothetical protein
MRCEAEERDGGEAEEWDAAGNGDGGVEGAIDEGNAAASTVEKVLLRTACVEGFTAQRCDFYLIVHVTICR